MASTLHRIHRSILPLTALATLLVTFVLVSSGAQAGRDHKPSAPPSLDERFAPRLAAEPVVDERPTWDAIVERHQVVPGVQLDTYGGIEAHPLLAEAAEILTRRLSPWASGVYVTSFARTPEDQLRLMNARRTRGWAISRSKHLMGGMAVDIGYVSRRVSTWRLRDAAEQVLREEMGDEKLSKLRVVREARCVHIEIDTWRGRDLLMERIDQLAAMGALRTLPEDGYPVPRLRDYLTAEERQAGREREAIAVAY